MCIAVDIQESLKAKADDSTFVSFLASSLLETFVCDPSHDDLSALSSCQYVLARRNVLSFLADLACKASYAAARLRYAGASSKR